MPEADPLGSDGLNVQDQSWERFAPEADSLLLHVDGKYFNMVTGEEVYDPLNWDSDALRSWLKENGALE